MRGAEVACLVQLERVALGAGGVESRHLAVHLDVARLVVALLAGGPGETRGPVRAGERVVGVVDADPHVAKLPHRALRERHAQDGREGLAAVERADRDLPAAPLPAAREVVERLDEGAFARVHDDDGLADGRAERLADLARDEVADLGGGLDEVEVAAAGVGHAAQQHLVEVGADAEAGRGDAVVALVRRPPHDLVVVGDPVVRETVGQEQAAADGLARAVLEKLPAADQPAAVEIGAAARLDRFDGPDRRLACLPRGFGARDDDLHVLVVRHDGKAVPFAQRPDADQDGVLGAGELLAVHRARAVDDEGEVDGKAPLSRLGLGCPDSYGQVAGAEAIAADERAVGAER